jgi:tetratricopeptide (TPR) repeat protein
MKGRPSLRSFVLGLTFLLACASSLSPQPPAVAPPPVPAALRPQSALESSLLEVADSAFERGEFERARGRYQRALLANPDSLEARLGLARVALRRVDQAGAREYAQSALAIDPGYPSAHVLLAGIEERVGNRATARRHLEAALSSDPVELHAHAALERLTGPASGALVGGDPLRAAQRHPYDPVARLAAGRLLLERDHPRAASKMLEAAVWLSDLDPEAGAEALRLLRGIEPSQADRRAVHVHCFADESVRADLAWRTRLRFEWRGLSHALDPALRTLFIPVSMTAVHSRESSADLIELERALLASVPTLPAQGVLAFFTEREAPRRRGTSRAGQARFLGRRLIVRLQPGEVGSRTLVHEVLHLYGGIHIADDVPSILNAGGTSRVVDPHTRRITSLMSQRRFGRGGLESNVLPFIDLDAAAEAYTEALHFDLTFRAMGVERALEASRQSRYVAAAIAKEAAALDPHLGDVARFTATLYVRQGRLAEAVTLLGVASQLYGPRTSRGRSAQARAERLLRMGQSRLPDGRVAPRPH